MNGTSRNKFEKDCGVGMDLQKGMVYPRDAFSNICPYYIKWLWS